MVGAAGLVGCGGAQAPREPTETTNAATASASLAEAPDVLERTRPNGRRPPARELRQYEARVCRWIPTETRQACPLLLGVQRIEDVEGGVRITFATRGDLVATVDHLRCHFAFAAAEGREGMETCAIYVHGAEVTAVGNAALVTTSDTGRVEELRMRVRSQAP
jgi:hypothetical protein